MLRNILFLTLFWGTLFAQPIPTVTIPDGIVDIENFPIQYYLDRDDNHTIETLDQAPFRTILSKRSLGYTHDQTFWFRFGMFNPSEHPRTLYIHHKDGYIYTKTFFYQQTRDHIVKSQDISHTVQVSTREVSNASPTFVVTLAPRETTYIYIQNQSRSTVLVNIQIMDGDTYTKAHTQKNIYLAFFFGILFSLGLYNFFLFFSIRRIEYFFYTLFIAGSISYLSYQSGFALEFFDLHSEPYKALLYGVSILQMALIAFSQKVLDTKHNVPKVHIVLYGVMAMPASMLFFGLFMGADVWLSMQAAFAMLAALALLVTGVIALYHGIGEAKYYLLAIGLYLTFALIGIAMFFDLLPYNHLTRNALYFASLSEVFSLSMLLSYRIGLLRQRATQSEQKLHQEIATRNKVLEQQVTERTAQFETLNKELEARIEAAVQEIGQKNNDLLRQSRLALMGEMMSMIAHQWRQPLATMMSVKHCMELDITMGHIEPKALLEQLNDLENYVQDMSKTISNFSEFFKPDSAPEAIQLDSTIQVMLSLVKNRIDRAQVTLYTNVLTDKTLFIYKNELIQVLLMILDNAFDVFEATKTPKPNITITVEEKDKHITIMIEDNAGGIPEAILPKIFEPYFSTKETRNRTGLGLYMCRTIVQEHFKGTITARNSAKGACFTLTLSDIVSHDL